MSAEPEASATGATSSEPYNPRVRSSLQPVVIPLASGEDIDIDRAEINPEEESFELFSGTLTEEKAGVSEWCRLTGEYWRLHPTRPDLAIAFAERGVRVLADTPTSATRASRIALLCQLANYFICLARGSPQKVLAAVRIAPLPPGTQAKGFWLGRAVAALKDAEGIDPSNEVFLDTQAALYQALGKPDDALKAFERRLELAPTCIVALLGKARILYAKKQFAPALKLYQTTLRLAPNSLPDPRVGIGLCFWQLGDKILARAAWERSLLVHPDHCSVARLLLGLEEINSSLDSTLGVDARAEAYAAGIKHVEAAWRAGFKSSATVALVLGRHFLRRSDWKTAIRMAEWSIQYSDTRLLIAEAHLLLGRALHAQGQIEEARPAFYISLEKNPDSLVAMLASAQALILRGEHPDAVNRLENVLRRDSQLIEALVNLAAVRTHLAATFQTAKDADAERTGAMELYERILRILRSPVLDPALAAAMNGHAVKVEPDENGETPELDPTAHLPPRLAQFARSPALFEEVGKLWATGDPSRALRAYREAVRLRRATASDEDTAVPAELFNNVGCLEHQLGQYARAQASFNDALHAAVAATQRSAGSDTDGLTGTIMFNLGVTYEAFGQFDEAMKTYEQNLLRRHPEWLEAKARLALILLGRKDADRAHDLLKQALSADAKNPELRALYTYFLVQTNQIKSARDFALETLKNHNRHDLYALCASGALLYSQARENRAGGSDGTRERAGKFLRAAEFFDKALQLDPQCAFAAQALAILLAEDALGLGIVAGLTPAEAASRSRKNLQDALGILTKVRDAVRDGSVYVNIGHCYFAREEWDRAVESYETASRRHYDGKSLPTLLYLARAWYRKAEKDKSFDAIQSSLRAAQDALALHPSDDTIRFNIATIQHKAVDLVSELPAARRTVVNIELAIRGGEEAQATFAELGANRAPNLPYNVDMAQQRESYGRTLMRRAVEILPGQREFEAEQAEVAEAARREREAERARLAELEAARLEEIRLRNAELAEQRRELAGQASNWYVRRAGAEDDNDPDGKKSGRKRKPAVRKPKAGEEGFVAPDDEDEETMPSKPRKRAKKAKTDSGDDAPALPDEDEDEEAPVQPKTRGSRKTFKSAEMVVDSDDEDS